MDYFNHIHNCADRGFFVCFRFFVLGSVFPSGMWAFIAVGCIKHLLKDLVLGPNPGYIPRFMVC